MPQLVGLRWTSDQSIAETSDNTQHSQQTNIHAPGGIRTHDLSRRVTIDLRLRSRGHWHRQIQPIPSQNLFLRSIFMLLYLQTLVLEAITSSQSILMKMPYALLISPMHAMWPIQLIPLHLTTIIVLVKTTNYKGSHYAIFSTLLLFPPPKDQIFFWAPCSIRYPQLMLFLQCQR